MKCKLVFLVILLSAAQTIRAQDKPSPEIRFVGGWAGFIDEETVDHHVVGGSIGFYVTRRLSIQPEFLYLIGPGSDRDITLIPHLAYDFRPDKSVRPYIVGGAGLIHQRQDFFLRGTSTYNEWSANFGVGVKIFVTPRVFLAPDFRIGWEPLVRLTGGIGFVF